MAPEDWSTRARYLIWLCLSKYQLLQPLEALVVHNPLYELAAAWTKSAIETFPLKQSKGGMVSWRNSSHVQWDQKAAERVEYLASKRF